MKNAWPFLFILTVFLWCGCSSGPKDTSILAPESGELCYKADDGTEYLQLVISKGKVEGRLINTAEDAILVKRFDGEVLPEANKQTSTEMRVTVTYADASEDKTWVMWFEEQGLSIKFNNEFLHFTKIPNDSLARLYNRLNETILAYKSTGFKLPKGESVCYQSVRSANGSYLIEFFQLWNVDGKLKGRGAGYYVGEPVWDFDFHGTMDKHIMKMTINYRKRGEDPHSVMETWKMDDKENRIYIKDPHSVLGAKEYTETENDAFLNFVHSYFEKEELER